MRPIRKSAWLLSLASAGLQILLFPLLGFTFLAWVAFAPLLLALLRTRAPENLLLETDTSRLRPASPVQGFLLAYVCGTLWYAGTCYWVFHTMHQYGGLSTPIALLLLLLFCMILGLFHGLFGLAFAWIASRPSRVQKYALLFSPFLWVAVELARCDVMGVPWNLLGTSQVANIPLSRVATVTGVYGLSFEIVLVNCAFVAAFLLPRGRRRPMLIGTAVVALVMQAGLFLIPPPSPVDHTAILLQPNLPVDGPAWTAEFYRQTVDELSQLSTPSAGTRVDLIVWPESPAPFYTRDPFFQEGLSQLARQTQTWVIAGSIGTDTLPSAQEPPAYNSAALMSPAGEFTSRYDKAHLVPFGEYVPFRGYLPVVDALAKQIGDFQAGTSREPLTAGDAKLGVFICYESVFPNEVRQFAKNGGQVLVNISNDGWYGDSGAWAQHILQARMRAVENQRWLLRSTNTGRTAAIDPYGRVVARLPRKQRLRLQAPYALISETTFYTRHGDWFAYACAIISLGAILGRFFKIEKQKGRA